ncbi:protein phosphatase 2C domain-containing protein [Streptococcus suis]|nr:protein phosphatase 2C domain-containing protein [Streptococcus suis]HEM3580781.1 protein phosphatase 2C domain-containing protein [Streptococcus suis]
MFENKIEKDIDTLDEVGMNELSIELISDSQEQRETESLYSTSTHFKDNVTTMEAEVVSFNSDETKTSEQDVRLIDNRYVIGEPAGTFYQKPTGLAQQNMPIFRNDNVSDALQIGSSLLLAASSKGSLHQAGESPRQDSYSYGVCDENGEKWIILAISDGVSSSPYSHILAEYLTLSSVKELKLQLEAYGEVYVQEFAHKINQMANNFCRKQLVRFNQQFDESKYVAHLGANFFGATLECAIIHIGQNIQTVRQFTISGDGGAYILKPTTKIEIIKSGKIRGDGIVSNAVSPLPLSIVDDINVKEVSLERGDIFFMATDGLSDFIGSGNSSLGRFLLDKIGKAKDAVEFLKIINVAIFQLDDDKTAICFKTEGA